MKISFNPDDPADLDAVTKYLDLLATDQQPDPIVLDAVEVDPQPAARAPQEPEAAHQEPQASAAAEARFSSSDALLGYLADRLTPEIAPTFLAQLKEAGITQLDDPDLTPEQLNKAADLIDALVAGGGS